MKSQWSSRKRQQLLVAPSLSEWSPREVVATSESKCGATGRVSFQDMDKQPACDVDDPGSVCPLVRGGTGSPE